MTALSTQKLYERACEKVAEANFPDYEGTRFLEVYFTLYRQALSEAGLHPLDNDINTELARIIDNLYLDERLDCVPEPSALVGTIDDGRYRDQLLLIIKRASDPTETLATFFDVLVEVAVNFTNHLQKYATVAPPFGSYDAELIDLIPDPHGAILAMYVPLFNEKARELGLFAAQRAQILSNEANVIDQNPKLKKARVPTPALHGAQPKESVRLYLRGTRLSPIFSHKVSFQGPDFAIPEATRFEHTHILGASGAGKTTLIQQIVLDDIAKPNPPAMVIIDPKGLLVERIQKLKVFDPINGRLKDRLVIIDPTHSPSPALNMFHPATKSSRMYSDTIRRQIENQAISNFAYIFSSVGSTLTDKQSVPFTFLVRLLFIIPNATIHTLLELLDDPAKKLADSKFVQFAGRLDAITRGFFEKDYYERNFSETRQQIKARLYSILMRPEFVDMFSAPERKLDMFDCLQSKKIVLVNTAMNALGRESSALLGRYMIALTLNAAFERITVPDHNQWTPAYLIIDEFQEFADEQKTPELLRLAREYNLGVVLAHSQMHSKEFDDNLRNSISTNTSIKYAASVEAIDLNYAARDLRCEPSFLTAQRRTGTHANFACFVRNLIDHAISVSVPLGNIGPEQQMTEAAHKELLRRNAAALSASDAPPAPAEPPSSPPPVSTPQTPANAAPAPPQTPQTVADTPEAGSTW
jgi:hypothetical protein